MNTLKRFYIRDCTPPYEHLQFILENLNLCLLSAFIQTGERTNSWSWVLCWCWHNRQKHQQEGNLYTIEVYVLVLSVRFALGGQEIVAFDLELVCHNRQTTSVTHLKHNAKKQCICFVLLKFEYIFSFSFLLPQTTLISWLKDKTYGKPGRSYWVIMQK